MERLQFSKLYNLTWERELLDGEESQTRKSFEPAGTAKKVPMKGRFGKQVFFLNLHGLCLSLSLFIYIYIICIIYIYNFLSLENISIFSSYRLQVQSLRLEAVLVPGWFEIIASSENSWQPF